jgi:hypothetical protein
VSEELVDRLRAALDQDERVALATRLSPSDSGDWIESHDNDGSVNGVLGTCIQIGLIGRNGDLDDPTQAVHIARYDPARVLRQVTAMRKLIDDLLAEPHADNQNSYYVCGKLTTYDGIYVTSDEDNAGVCTCGLDKRLERRLDTIAEALGINTPERLT